MNKSFTARGNKIKYGDTELLMQSNSSLLSRAGRALCRAVEHEEMLKMSKDTIKEMRRGEMVMDNHESRVGSIVEVFNSIVTIRWNNKDNLQVVNLQASRGFNLTWDDEKCYWLLD